MLDKVIDFLKDLVSCMSAVEETAEIIQRDLSPSVLGKVANAFEDLIKD
jgi:hypothetical protein